MTICPCHHFAQFLSNSWNAPLSPSSALPLDTVETTQGVRSAPCLHLDAGLFQALCFHDENAPSWTQIKQILRDSPSTVIAVCRKQSVDVYAQSPLDPAPIVAHDLPCDAFADLAGCQSFPELTFELDRRFGKRRLESRFVSEFRRHVEKLANAWTGIPRDAADKRQSLALTTLLRLFFVAFLESRSILDDRKQFMHDEATQRFADGQNLYRDFLQPLFFETLNRPYRYRTPRAREFGAIPFLNGGLFTPSPLEVEFPSLDAPGEIWLDILENLFGKYALSVAADAQDRRLALDPMMLGHVFESLMAHDKKSATGSYYTPMPLARQIVADTFRHWLHAEFQIDDAQFERLCIRHDFSSLSQATARKIEASLSRITILDPAVGSGAFLQCALVFLHRFRSALRNHCHIPTHSGHLARQILATNLFGVDIIPMSGQICELRLWLELMQFFAPGEGIPPLPNLDMNIHCGDSLTDLSQLLHYLGIQPPKDKDDVDTLANLKSKYRLSTGCTKKRLANQIHERIHDSGKQIFHTLIEACDREYEQFANARSLFDKAPSPTTQQKQRMQLLRTHRDSLQRAIDSDALPGFSYSLHFGDILADGGFDIVIGNPPWYSLHVLPTETRDVLKTLYQSAQSASGCNARSPDISALFIEKSLQCVRPGGLLTMLIPNKLFLAPSYAPFRNHVDRNAVVLQRTDYSNANFNAFAARTYPASLTLMRPTKDIPAKPYPWHREPACDKSSEFPDDLPTIADSFAIRRGPYTGANDVFIASVPQPHPDGTAQDCVFAHASSPVAIENSLLRPVLRGADVHECDPVPQKRIVFAHDAQHPTTPMQSLPPLAARWFDQNAETLRNRRNLGKKPIHALFGCTDELRCMKVVWKDISYHLEAAFVPDAETIPLNTVYFIPVQSHDEGYLLSAFLNSSKARQFCRARAEHAYGDYRRYFACVVQNLPWPFAPQCRIPAALRDEIIALSKQCHEATAAERPAIRARIDALLDRGLSVAKPVRMARTQRRLPLVPYDCLRHGA